MQESVIEKKLQTEAKKHNGIAAKFVSPGLSRVPDRLLLLPGGKCAFVELKAPAVAGKTEKTVGMFRFSGLLH